MELLLTRPADASERFLRDLEAELGQSVAAVVSPLLRIAPEGPLPALDPAATVVFTSQAGVASFEALGGTGAGRAWCVGVRTAEAAERLGFVVAGVAQDADDLVARVTGPGPFIHLHGRFTRGEIVARLTARGLPARGVCLYDQVAQPLSAEAQNLLAQEGPLCVPLFSPRTADLLAKAVPSDCNRKLFVCAMSPAVAAAASALTVEACSIAPEPSAESMLKTVANRLREAPFT